MSLIYYRLVSLSTASETLCLQLMKYFSENFVLALIITILMERWMDESTDIDIDICLYKNVYKDG